MGSKYIPLILIKEKCFAKAENALSIERLRLQRTVPMKKKLKHIYR